MSTAREKAIAAFVEHVDSQTHSDGSSYNADELILLVMGFTNGYDYTRHGVVYNNGDTMNDAIRRHIEEGIGE